MEILKTIQNVTAKIASGPSPTFTEAHVIKALEEINIKGCVGRLKLSKDLHLGEGQTRTLVKHLKNEGLIAISKFGISLSKLGKSTLSEYRIHVKEHSEVQPSSLTVGPFNEAVLVKNSAKSINFGLEQRDIAVLAGAKGATTLIFSKGKLVMAGTEDDVSKKNAVLSTILMSKLKPKNGDTIIIVSGDRKIKAEIGAKMVALQLLRQKSRTHG